MAMASNTLLGPKLFSVFIVLTIVQALKAQKLIFLEYALEFLINKLTFCIEFECSAYKQKLIHTCHRIHDSTQLSRE